MIAVAVFFSVAPEVGNAEVIGEQYKDVRPFGGGGGGRAGKYDACPAGQDVDDFDGCLHLETDGNLVAQGLRYHPGHIVPECLVSTLGIVDVCFQEMLGLEVVFHHRKQVVCRNPLRLHDFRGNGVVSG